MLPILFTGVPRRVPSIWQYMPSKCVHKLIYYCFVLELPSCQKETLLNAKIEIEHLSIFCKISQSNIIAFCMCVFVCGEGNGTPLQYSCLENPMDGRAWQAAVHGVAKRWTQLRLHFHFSLSCIGEGNGNPLQCFCLENPRDGGAWWAAISGVAQSRTRLKRLSSSSSSSSSSVCLYIMNVYLSIKIVYT